MAPNAGKKRVAAFRKGNRGYDSVQNAWGIMFGSNAAAGTTASAAGSESAAATSKRD